MVRGLSIFVALFGLCAGPAFAQEVDARAALLASLKAMGGENLKTIEITAAGSSSLIGQQYTVEGNWPQFEVANYTRRSTSTPNGRARTTRDDRVTSPRSVACRWPSSASPRSSAAPTRGTCATRRRWRSPVRISMAYPFNELRQLELAITPHGFLKEALAARTRRRSRSSLSAHRTSAFRSSADG